MSQRPAALSGCTRHHSWWLGLSLTLSGFACTAPAAPPKAAPLSTPQAASTGAPVAPPRTEVLPAAGSPSSVPPSPDEPPHATAEAIAGAQATARTEFDAGTAVTATPLHGRRFIDVGYVQQGEGPVERQLVIIEYAYTSNFHQEVHYPNRICALFVNPGTRGEPRVVEQALEALAHGSVPNENSAYQWALRYKLPTAEDCFAAKRSADGTLVADAQAWSIRTVRGGIAFRAAHWQSTDGLKLVLTSKSEAADSAAPASESKPRRRADSSVEY